MNKLRQLRKRLNLRRDLTGRDYSSSPQFTEGPAVAGPGLVGPAYIYADPDVNPR